VALIGLSVFVAIVHRAGLCGRLFSPTGPHSQSILPGRSGQARNVVINLGAHLVLGYLCGDRCQPRCAGCQVRKISPWMDLHAPSRDWAMSHEESLDLNYWSYRLERAAPIGIEILGVDRVG
jgi:hypothetical protein